MSPTSLNKNMPAPQCTEPQCQVLKEWMYPAWFQPATCKGKEGVAPKPTEHPVSVLPECLPSQSPECPTPSVPETTLIGGLSCPLPQFPELPPPHADGWQPCQELEECLNMPKLRDLPELWVEWIDQHLAKCPHGIRVKPDGCVSLRSICRMKLIKQQNPPITAGDRKQTQYLCITAQLFALPNAHYEAIQCFQLTVANG